MENDIVRMLFLRRQRQKKRWKIKTISGAPPLSFKAKAGALKDYRIYGDTVDGESVGDRTGNLFDEIYPEINVSVKYRAIYVGTGFFTLSGDIPIFSNTANLFLLSGNVSSGASFSVNGVGYGASRSVESIDGYITIGYRNLSDVDPRDYNIMLNSGSTPLPYEPYGYKVPVTVSNGTDTLTTPIYLPEQIKKVGDEAEYIDYAEQKLHRVRKNLLKITIGNMTMGRDNDDPVTYPGVTITINADKSITFNGRARSTLYIPIGSIDDLKKGSYYLSGCPINGADNSYKLYVQNQSITSFDIGSGVRFNYISSLSTLSALIRLYGGYTCDNLTFYPMVRKASIEDDTYEPYIEDTELDVTLPALPTLAGTNVLTVRTAVQPSDVYIKGRMKKGE